MAWSIYSRRIGKATVRFSSDVFMRVIKNEMLEFANTEVLPKYQETCWNWKPEHQPDFRVQWQKNYPSIELRVGCSSKYDIYLYIDKGTQIRWAVMSSDWESKTNPSRYQSYQGHGRVTARGRWYMQMLGMDARPGIEPRNFSEQIYDATWNRWRLDMRYAVQRARIAMEQAS